MTAIAVPVMLWRMESALILEYNSRELESWWFLPVLDFTLGLNWQWLGLFQIIDT